MNRKQLEQTFDNLYIGELEDIGKLSDEQLEGLIADIESLLVQYPGGVESSAFIDALAELVDSYLE